MRLLSGRVNGPFRGRNRDLRLYVLYSARCCTVLKSGRSEKVWTVVVAEPGAAMNLVEETPFRWRIDPVGQMRVPGMVFASRSLLPDVISDRSLHQVADVATLPSIVEASYAMPDVHWGYGFPIGGVAATDVARGGVVSPGGVGFDISCGVRLLISPLQVSELDVRLPALMDELDRRIPRGMGPGGIWQLRDDKELSKLLTAGS